MRHFIFVCVTFILLDTNQGSIRPMYIVRKPRYGNYFGFGLISSDHKTTTKPVCFVLTTPEKIAIQSSKGWRSLHLLPSLFPHAWSLSSPHSDLQNLRASRLQSLIGTRRPVLWIRIRTFLDLPDRSLFVRTWILSLSSKKVRKTLDFYYRYFETSLRLFNLLRLMEIYLKK